MLDDLKKNPDGKNNERETRDFLTYLDEQLVAGTVTWKIACEKAADRGEKKYRPAAAALRRIDQLFFDSVRSLVGVNSRVTVDDQVRRILALFSNHPDGKNALFLAKDGETGLSAMVALAGAYHPEVVSCILGHLSRDAEVKASTALHAQGGLLCDLIKHARACNLNQVVRWMKQMNVKLSGRGADQDNPLHTLIDRVVETQSMEGITNQIYALSTRENLREMNRQGQFPLSRMIMAGISQRNLSVIIATVPEEILAERDRFGMNVADYLSRTGRAVVGVPDVASPSQSELSL